MFASYNFRNITAFFLLGYINLHYVFKYSSVYTPFPALAALIFTLSYLIFLVVIYRFGFKSKSLLNKKSLVFFCWIALALLFAYTTFVPRFGNIGRAPSIAEWWDRFFSGLFPYNNSLTASSFPFIFLLSLPLHLIGKLSYLQLFGTGLFFFLLFKFSRNVNEISVRMLLLFISLVFYYEVAVHSELFTNSVLILFAIHLAEIYLKHNYKLSTFVFVAIAFGFAASTRSILGLVIAMYVFYKFKSEPLRLLTFSVMIILVFVFLLLPFVLWDWNSFLEVGPFSIQSRLSGIPAWLPFILFIVSMYAGYKSKSADDVFFFGGVILFASVIISLMIKIFQSGFQNAVIGDVFDQAYLAFSVPFLILSVSLAVKNKAPAK